MTGDTAASGDQAASSQHEARSGQDETASRQREVRSGQDDTASSQHEIVQTRGGALAMRSVAAGEVMHPGVGPVVEAEQLYVRQSRLDERLRATPAGRTLVVYDVGLGAGSNAFAAWAAAARAPSAAARLTLLSFERDLGALALALEHAADFAIAPDATAAGRALLSTGAHETPRTSWRLVPGDVLLALQQPLPPADIVFWDPFSPRANPDLWSIAAFRAAHRRAAERCTLFTYSASTATRVALLLAGWSVGVGASIGDKTATTAAAIDATDLAAPLGRDWLRRLARPDVPLPPDAAPDFAGAIAGLSQFSL
jgi:queuine tRNA-ribosyltransferase